MAIIVFQKTCATVACGIGGPVLGIPAAKDIVTMKKGTVKMITGVEHLPFENTKAFWILI